MKTFKKIMWCVECTDYTGGGKIFCEPTLKKAFKELQRLLYI